MRLSKEVKHYVNCVRGEKVNTVPFSSLTSSQEWTHMGVIHRREGSVTDGI